MLVDTFRALEPSDATGILAILLAAESAEPAEQYVDLTEVQENLTLPGVDLPRGSVAALDGDRLVAFATLFVPQPVGELTAHLSGGVLPGYRRRGLGRELLRRITDQARSLRDADHPGLPGELKVMVHEGRHSAAAFARAAGLTTRRYFFDMQADLAGPNGRPEAGQLAGMEIRPWTIADDEGTRLAYNAAFADHWGSMPAEPDRWRHLFAESSVFRPEFSRLAIQDGTVAGFVLVDEFDSETAARGYRTGYIDRVGTIRAARGRGVAAVLMAHSMAALAATGCRSAELGVDADSPTGAGRLYERLGFRVQRRNEVVGLDF